MRKTLWTAGLLALAACQSPSSSFVVWKPGASYDQTQRDTDQCRIAALREVPQSLATQVSGGVYVPGNVQCSTIGTLTSCNRVGGVNIPASSTTYDVNEELRSRQINRCLQAKGYSVTVLPDCVGDTQKTKAAADKAAGRKPSCAGGASL